MAENCPNLMKDMNINIQEVQWTPRMMKSETPTMKHIIINPSKTKNLKSNKTEAIYHIGDLQ